MNKFKYIIFSMLVSFLIAVSIGCSSHEKKSQDNQTEITKAIAVLRPTKENTASGIVTFTKQAEGIKISADIEGLTPGKHGFHIHQWGDISSPDATSAGGHFNPDSAKHDGPLHAERHVGDLGNLEADSKGNAHYERIDTLISFTGKHSVIGRAVIVHAGEDNFKTQPTGGAGARVARGIIGIADGS